MIPGRGAGSPGREEEEVWRATAASGRPRRRKRRSAARLKTRRTLEMEGAPRGRAAAQGGAQTAGRGCGPPRLCAQRRGRFWGPRSGSGAGRRARGSGAAPGQSGPPVASPSPAPPRSARPHLTSLPFLFPSSLRTQRKGAPLPFPWGAPPGPPPRLPFPPRPGAGGGSLRVEAPSSGRAGA